MRRKNRKWIAVAAALYLFVMWSAYRWAIAQRPTDGPLLEHIQREAIRKLTEERAKVAAAAQPKPTGESRLNAAGPAYVAARYDDTHVVFMVTLETEARFANSRNSSQAPTKIPASSREIAQLAGFSELWEPDSQTLHFFPEIIQSTRPGEEWSLNLASHTTIPVVIERPVIAPIGCSLAMGFLATVPIDHHPAFAAVSSDYFAVRKKEVQSEEPPFPQRKNVLPNWHASASSVKQIEEQLNERMKREIAQMDARLIANAGSPGATAGEAPVGQVQPRLKEWLHADRALARGEGTLDYAIRAFRLTPDGAPRLFVRARWKLANTPVFLMTAWFKAGESDLDEPRERQTKPLDASDTATPPEQNAVAPVLLWTDAKWSAQLRQGETSGDLGNTLNFQAILNVFDADQDGWDELLVYSDEGNSTMIALSLYTDMGLVPLKMPLHRDAQAPEACLDP